MNDFNEAMFKTKVDNIFVKLYTCIMKGDLTDVKHFISKDLYNMFMTKINELSSSNNISYEKSIELRKQHEEVYKKWLFYKNLQKTMSIKCK